MAEAAAELRAAETAGPGEADYAFALATVLLRRGDGEGARQAAERALRINPAHSGARQVLDAPR